MPAITTSRDFYLADVESTLFPLTTNRLMVDKFAKQIKEFIVSDILPEERGFQNQHRVYASKRGWYLRATLKLDPVAEFFLYDFVYRNRALFRKSLSTKRRVVGFCIVNGQPLPALTSYSQFKKAIADHRAHYAHSVYIDVTSYFNHIYHHDLTRWLEDCEGSTEDVKLFGRFLREIVGGRSIDCLPHGLYPAKMIGSAFLSFLETSNRIRSTQTLRLMDDIWLFDDDKSTLIADFLLVQRLLSSRGLSINERKSAVLEETDLDEELPSDIDEMKITLLQRRREELSSAGYSDDSESNEEELQELTEDEQTYLISLLDKETIQEEDAELVLTLMRDHAADVMEFLPGLIERFPSLSKRVYYFCRGAEDTSGITSTLLTHLKASPQITEFQLFWYARMAEDYLLKTPKAGDLLVSLYEHENATDITKAKILEIPEKRFGLPDLREEQLRTGHSDWLAWTAAVGSRVHPKGQRNQLLKYFRKSSHMNRLIGEFVETVFNK